MTIPRTDPLQPEPERGIPARGVPLEKLEEGAIQAQIDASIPAPGTQVHKVMASVHDDIYNLTLQGGLNVLLDGGRAVFDVTVYDHAPTAFVLTASATNYIAVNPGGSISASTIPNTSGMIPLWRVTTDATSVTGQTDQRAVIRGGSGGGGGGSNLEAAYNFGGAGAGAAIDVNDGPVVLRNTQADTMPNLDILRAAADIDTQPSLQVGVDGELGPRLVAYGDKIGFGPGTAIGPGTTGPDIYIKRISSSEIAIERTSPAAGQALRLHQVSNTPAAPAAGVHAIIYNALFGTNTRFFVKHSDGVTLGPLGDIASEFLFQRAQVGFFSAPHTNTWQDGFYGLLGGVGTPTGAGVVVANDTGGRYLNFTQAAATTGLKAGFETINPCVRRNSQPRYLFKVVIPTVTLCRVFIGFSNQTLATMLAADNPAGHYCGFQFSTPRADTTWVYTQKDNATQRNVVSTATVTAAATYYLLIFMRGALAIRFDIYDSSFTLLQSSTGSILSQPGNTTDMSFMAGIETESNALRPIQFYYANLLCQNI